MQNAVIQTAHLHHLQWVYYTRKCGRREPNFFGIENEKLVALVFSAVRPDPAVKEIALMWLSRVLFDVMSGILSPHRPGAGTIEAMKKQLESVAIVRNVCALQLYSMLQAHHRLPGSGARL